MLGQHQSTAARGARFGAAQPGASAPRLGPCPLRHGLKAFSQCDHHRRAGMQVCRAQQEVDIDSAVEAFMKRQAELESGAAFARTVDREKVIGADVVDEEAARKYCREIFEVLRTLKNTRDMSVAEVKLVVSIEDPRTKEKRMQGMEDERGVSRDEMAVALLEVAEGRVPKDRIALKCLWDEVTSWPFLEAPPASPASSTSAASSKPSAPTQSDYQSLLNGDTVVKPYIMGKEARRGDKPQDLGDMLPDWVGYVTLYGISAIPVFIVIATVAVLFASSLK